MALRWFGGPDAALTVQNPETGAWMPNDAGTVWDAEVGGTKLTELVDANQATIPGGDIYTDDYGYPVLFGVDTDPATEVVWCDFTGGQGQRVRLECRDRASYRLSGGQLGAPYGIATLDADKHLAQRVRTANLDGTVSPAQLDPVPASKIADPPWMLPGEAASGWANLRDQLPALVYTAHRCDANIHPEESLEGARLVVAKGSAQVVEMDVHLLADGVLACQHNTNVDSMLSPNLGAVEDQTSTSWRLLTFDGDWGPAFPVNTVHPTLLDDMLRELADRIILSVEPKTMEAANALPAVLDRHVHVKDNITVASNDMAKLTPSQDAGYPIAYRPNGESASEIASWGVNTVNVPHAGLDATKVDSWHSAGLKVQGWTIERQWEADRIIGMGADGVITDDSGYVSRKLRRTSDPFKAQVWYPGHLTGGDRNSAEPNGSYVAPNEWGFANAQPGTANCESAVLQGWACPIKDNPDADSYTIDLHVRASAIHSGASLWCAALSTTDEPYGGHVEVTPDFRGYVFEEAVGNAVLRILWHPGDGTNVVLGTFSYGSRTAPQEYDRTITVTPTSITFGTGTSVATADPATHGAPGGYLHLGSGGCDVRFSNVTVS